MVSVFTSCDTCQNKIGCKIRPQLDQVYAANSKIINLNSRISVRITCNDYKNDYGRSLGN